MAQSAYGDQPGNSAHTGFLPGSGIQAHSAGSLLPYVISTVENYDTGFGRKYVFDGRDGKERYSSSYRIGDSDGCFYAGRRAENAARSLRNLPAAYDDYPSAVRFDEVLK